MVTKIYEFHNVPPIWPILQKGKKVVQRLSEYGDVIETQTVRFAPVPGMKRTFVTSR